MSDTTYNNKSTSHLPIQPNIPTHMMLQRTDSGGRRIISQKPSPNFPTKKLRMRSLLWQKPTGLAVTNISSTLKQVWPSVVVNLAALSSGLSLGFSAIALPQLEANGTAIEEGVPLYQPFTVGMEAGSWIAGIFGLGAVFGGFTTAFVGSHFGRRKALMFMAVPDMLGWILIATAQNLPMMLAGRFLSGFSAAGYSPSIQIYIAEIAQPQHRGWLCGLTMPTLATGSLAAYIIGSLAPWHYAALFGSALPVIMLMGLAALPDSPYWHLQNNNERQALSVMERFRSSEANALAELLAISDSLQTGAVEYGTADALRHLMSRRQYRRPFAILNGLFFLTAFSGNFAITFYAVNVFERAGGLDKYLSAILTGVLKLVGSLLFLPAVRYLSRRSLICGSALVMGTALCVLGAAVHPNSGLDNLQWLPLVAVTIYMLADPIGLGSVPFLYTAEFFPTEVRSALSGATIGLSNLELFAVVKTFPNLALAIGAAATFWVYAGFCFLAVIYTLVFIPETRGRTLEDIERYFSHKESMHATPLSTPATSKRGLAVYPHLSIQFTL